MSSWIKDFYDWTQSKDSKSHLQWTAVLTLVVLVGLAGVISDDSTMSKKSPKDPRLLNAESVTINPMDEDYMGCVPKDAIIVTKEGFYQPNDDTEGFKKLKDKNK